MSAPLQCKLNCFYEDGLHRILRYSLLLLITRSVVFAGMLLESSAMADPWDDVVKRLSPGAEIVLRTDHRLEVSAAGWTERIRLGTEDSSDTNIYFKLKKRRGKNPYRVWYVRESFLREAAIPKQAWPQFLQVSFLRLLRVDRET